MISWNLSLRFTFVECSLISTVGYTDFHEFKRKKIVRSIFIYFPSFYSTFIYPVPILIMIISKTYNIAHIA